MAMLTSELIHILHQQCLIKFLILNIAYFEYPIVASAPVTLFENNYDI